MLGKGTQETVTPNAHPAQSERVGALCHKGYVHRVPGTRSEGVRWSPR